MTDIWYARYVGDYQRKTSHLSILEHGAYNLLLDHYYATGRPLPANASVLHRICRAFASDEQAAVQSVIDQFFYLENGFYYNKKAEQELAKRCNLSEKRRQAAQKRHHPDDAIAGANAKQMDVQLDTQPQPQPHIEDIYIGENEKPGGKQRENEFEQFWSAYPRKVAKGAARRAFKGCCPKKVGLDALIDAAKRYAEKRKGQDVSFTKHPATWLNSEGWLDEDLQPKSVEAPTDPERNLWLARINGFRERNFWNPMTWGPPPDEPGFRGPKDLTI